MRQRIARASLLVVLLALLLAPTRLAWAHGEGQAPATPTSDSGMAVGHERARLEVDLPSEITLGDTVAIRAVLTETDGHPIAGATIYFERPMYWGEAVNGHALIGTAMTDRHGVATITDEMRTAGESDVDAIFPGDAIHRMEEASASFTVTGNTQLFESHTGIKIPWLNLWVLGMLIGFVWILYFVVGLRVLEIVREGWQDERDAAPEVEGATRRQFLTHAVPYTAQAAIAVMGGALIAVVARSPRTHGNLLAPPQTEGFARSPVARIGAMSEMRAMPEPLTRPVSFANEVLPIFQRHGGPHVVRPTSSPPPGNLMLDSYDHLMAKEGVVVAGDPEASELMEHLLSAGMQMPPSVPPLPDEVVQVIVTWIAQGAKNN